MNNWQFDLLELEALLLESIELRKMNISYNTTQT